MSVQEQPRCPPYTLITLYSSLHQRQSSFRCLGLLFKRAGTGTGSSVQSHHRTARSITPDCRAWQPQRVSQGLVIGVRWKTWLVRTDRASLDSLYLPYDVSVLSRPGSLESAEVT